MFIKDSDLVFVESAKIKAFPCGRRSAVQVDNDGSGTGDPTYIPFDPEARLNTEANNTRHSSINGFTQTYILKDWTNGGNRLVFAIAGYLFELPLDSNYSTVELFGEKLADLLGIGNTEEIYANILLEEITFVHGNNIMPEARTTILRNQRESKQESLGEASLHLDQLLSNGKYYFTGLSFTNSKRIAAGPSQKPESICLLKKVNEKWSINEAEKLPEISHGDEPDSVVLKKVFANSVVLEGDSKVPKITLDNNNRLKITLMQ
jgi:hypothetical protein